MKAPSSRKYLPPVASSYSIAYTESTREEKDCQGCPFAEARPRGEIKCKSTGTYNPYPGKCPSSCPYPTKPVWVKDEQGLVRPVCPQGTAYINLRLIHWAKRAEVGQSDMNCGCIPAMVARGGEPRPLEGFWLDVQVLTRSRAKWSYYSIAWGPKKEKR
jgi:hypothetical protein